MPATLIVSAWEPEVAPLRRLLRSDRAIARGVALAAAGVGAIDAAAGAARAIARAAPRRVIFVGTAGAYPTSADAPSVGAVAVAGLVRLVSTAALTGAGYLPGPLVAEAAADRALARDLRAAARPRLLLAGVACPVAITRSAALARRIAGVTGAELENLEVFAVARAAAAAGAAFGAVLGVANRVGPRSHVEWRAHHLTASEAACRAVARWLGLAEGPPRTREPSRPARRPR